MSKLFHISPRGWHKVAMLLILSLFLGCQAEPDAEPIPLDATGSSAIGPNRPHSAAHNKVLAEIRSATARYHRIEVAEADGYVVGSPCVMSPNGGMGVHYLKSGLIDHIVDPSQPEALLYEPQKNGKMKLVAVEFIVAAAPWDAMHNYPPMLGDQVFDDHRAPGSPGPPFPHYQLHAWVWEHNPAGMHTPYNPNISCMYAD